MTGETLDEPYEGEPRTVGGKPPEADEKDGADDAPAETPSEEIEDPAEGEAPSG